MGIFSGAGLKLSNVAVGGGKALDFKAEGDFVLEITEVKGGKTRKNDAYFEVMHKVTESTNPEQPVGSTVNLFCMIKEDLGQKNMKEILSVMSGLNPYVAQDVDKINTITDDQWIQIAELACADQKTFGGTKVCCSVSLVEIKNPKKRTHYYGRRYTPHPDTVAATNAAGEKPAAKGAKK